ncbi:SRPBCC family protein [Paenibacillus sp. tmac-D7]|uniref:aromatic ring-hydroxylating oxygenase subunit alpha n=1 Tax=Paenibacillus sp. tmac-D7 TaxID=2591462 RepID=UPI0011437588|nr:SRPBCC family protein [Paenibacillus sp. tmac-D7]
MLNLDKAIRDQEGYIDSRIFTDEELYRLEMEKVFQHTWLFVGHESSLPKPGDYILNKMGEDEVIVVRDRSNRVRVFLNRCTHRGNKVCLFDRGSQKSFTCTFHGWQYNIEGGLMGLPQGESYAGSLKREEWGLKEVPKVSSYGGLIFASWDEEICSLDDYLGDIRWYLDRMLLKPFLGGIEVLPGRGKYMMPTNWKMMADNFMHDEYHVPITHVSFFRALMHMSQNGGDNWMCGNQFDRGFNVLATSPAGVPHAAGLVEFWNDPRPDSSAQVQPLNDRAIAERLGPEAVEWLQERERRMKEFMEEEQHKVHGSANWTIFPNLSLILMPGALRASGIIQWHPKGPMMLEGWQWFAVEKDAPDVVKRYGASVLAADQAPAGMITTDDTENFDRMYKNVISKGVEERPFNYAMPGIDLQRFYEEFREAGLDLEALPGTPLPVFTEEKALAFYQYYRDLMKMER